MGKPSLWNTVFCSFPPPPMCSRGSFSMLSLHIISILSAIMFSALVPLRLQNWALGGCQSCTRDSSFPLTLLPDLVLPPSFSACLWSPPFIYAFCLPFSFSTLEEPTSPPSPSDQLLLHLSLTQPYLFSCRAGSTFFFLNGGKAKKRCPLIFFSLYTHLIKNLILIYNKQVF